MNEHRKHEVYLWGGIIGGGVLLLFVFHPFSGGAPQPIKGKGGGAQPPPQKTVTPNPNQSTVDQALLSAREAALGLYDSSAVAEMSLHEQQNVAYNTNLTNRQINANQDAAAVKEVGLQTAAQQAIAQEEAAVQQQYISAQQSIAQQQQSNSWWQSILGFFGNIGGLFAGGFNPFGSLFGGSSAPIGMPGSYTGPSQFSGDPYTIG